jgi:hypothetical protein
MYGVSFAITALLVSSGCAHRGPPVTGSAAGQTGVTSAQKDVDTGVVERLAAARCDQEQECKNVGAGAKYSSLSVCMDEIRESIGHHLNADQCRHGLDRDAVDRCMVSIKREECSHPFDTLLRYDDCRPRALCLK